MSCKGGVSMKTRNQEYASKVYKLVFEAKSKLADQKKRDKYGSMAHSLAPLIRSAGLCQALQFVHTRKEEPLDILLEHLAKALHLSNSSELLKRAQNSELLEYTKLSRDVLLALAWFKRFAQSVLDVDATAGE